ncbi:MAG: hypothetical protein ACNS64_10010 [Candidatus Halalkalibacterium sp. M3_1C_030]
MNEEERKKLAAQRKKEQAERELQFDLNRDLQIQDQKDEIERQAQKERNKYTDWAIIFLGTLIPLYLFLFGFKFLFMVFFGSGLGLLGLSFTEVDTYLDTLLHIFIWAFSIFSVYRERSILEEVAEIFF